MLRIEVSLLGPRAGRRRVGSAEASWHVGLRDFDFTKETETGCAFLIIQFQIFHNFIVISFLTHG